MLIKILAVCTVSWPWNLSRSFSYTQSDLWFSAALLWGCWYLRESWISFIIQISGNVLKRLELLAVTVPDFGIALVFRFDLHRHYLPDADKIACMSVNNWCLANVYHQVMTYTEMSSTSTTSEDSIQVLDSYQLTEFEPIYAMAENEVRTPTEEPRRM